MSNEGSLLTLLPSLFTTSPVGKIYTVTTYGFSTPSELTEYHQKYLYILRYNPFPKVVKVDWVSSLRPYEDSCKRVGTLHTGRGPLRDVETGT